MLRRKKSHGFLICPHCGALIPARSSACPECGSDNETGWRDDALIVDALPPDEEELDRSRPRGNKRLIRYPVTGIAALLLASWVTIEFSPFGLYIGLGIIVTAAIALILSRKRPLFARMLEKRLERELLSLSGHDPARLERLVMYERERKPNASRAELLQNAINRLLHDRNR